ncbi:MAG TPA: polysaccharide biosynthesis/export family protein [Pyrinomonadaceae bacterium]
MSFWKRVPLVFALSLLPLGATFAQRNNPFSANPDVRSAVASAKHVEPAQVDIAQAIKSREVRATEKPSDLTHIYRIGPGDALYIVLANAPNAAGYYSVDRDGTIDFPLAGNAPRVGGMTVEEIEHELSSRIKLYSDARVSVKVREFGSHKINVSGLVERNGERSLQREMMPLFTIKATAGVDRAATVVVIRHSSGSTEIYRLADPHTDNVSVSAGDTIEFAK